MRAVAIALLALVQDAVQSLESANQKQDRPYLISLSVSATLLFKSLYTCYTTENTCATSYAVVDSWPMKRDYLHPGAKADF
jgi:hypothetical protein